MTQPTSPNGAKTPRLRSPAYPGINLETAITRANEFHAKERRNAAYVTVAVQHWGFKPTSGGAYIVVAALKSFGLMDEEGSGSERKVKLSNRGLRIVLDEREASEERAAAIKEAALAPRIHAELWSKYGAHLPSDANLRHELIFDWKFNENAVDTFIKEYKDTISFAKLTASDVISSNREAKYKIEDALDGSGSDVPQVGEFVQWESQGVLRLPGPRRVRAVSEDGEWAFLEGSNTGVSVKDLTVVDAPTIEKPAERHAPLQEPPKPKLEKPPGPPSASPPTMRSYAWALSGDFNAKLELFGEARSEEDIDALSDYVEITIKALKRSLRASQEEKEK